MITVATGQGDNTFGGTCENPQAYCESVNSICVGGYTDENSRVYGDTDDDVALGLAGFHYLDPEPESDREEPDVTGLVHFDITKPNNEYDFGAGTSYAAPTALAVYAASLNAMAGDQWSGCRVSEMTRGAAKFFAGTHPVQHPIACANNSDCYLGGTCLALGFCSVGEPRTTAWHDLLVSGNIGGLQEGNICYEANDCLRGLACIAGRCAQNPGDEMTGWGGVAPITAMIDGTYSCRASGGPVKCLPTADGTCGLPSKPADDKLPQGMDLDYSIRPAPGKSGISGRGKLLERIYLTLGQTYRGVLSWSSCPNNYDLSNQVPCQTDDDCPGYAKCFGGILCGAQWEILDTIEPDFDVFAWRVGSEPDELIWLSSSRHDNIEAFEFTAPESGEYAVVRHATEEDWPVCDPSLSQHFDPKIPTFGGVYEFYIGGAK